MDNNKKKLSNIFNNKAVKGAAIGAGVAVVGAAVLPVVTVSVPVIAIGAAIGAYIGYKKD